MGFFGPAYAKIQIGSTAFNTDADGFWIWSPDFVELAAAWPIQMHRVALPVTIDDAQGQRNLAPAYVWTRDTCQKRIAKTLRLAVEKKPELSLRVRSGLGTMARRVGREGERAREEEARENASRPDQEEAERALNVPLRGCRSWRRQDSARGRCWQEHLAQRPVGCRELCGHRDVRKKGAIGTLRAAK